jgi:hypothetical protein
MRNVFHCSYELGTYIAEVGILHGYRRKNLKSYICCLNYRPRKGEPIGELKTNACTVGDLSIIWAGRCAFVFYCHSWLVSNMVHLQMNCGGKKQTTFPQFCLRQGFSYYRPWNFSFS